MLIQIFLKTILLPATIISVFVVVAGFMKGLLKDLLQSLIFLLGITYALYQIRGGVGQIQMGGMESVLALPSLVFLSFLMLVLQFIRSLSRLITVFLAISILALPLVDSFSLQFVNLSNPVFRVSAAFLLLTWSLWSYSERQYANGYWVSQTVAASVAWGAAGLYFLFKSSALMSQFFGFFATLCGILVALGLVLKWRMSYRASAGFLVALPLLLLSAGALFTNASPLSTMALMLPFLVTAVRPSLSVHGSALREALIVGFLSVLSVAWIVYQAY